MAPTSRAWFCSLLVCLLLNNAFAAKPGSKIRLEDIENDNNKRTQDINSQKAQEASQLVSKQQQQVPQGGILPHQFFQFGQQQLPDYSAAFQGAVSPQLYLGQREQLALLEALGQQPSHFSVSPFHGLYGPAAGHGIPSSGGFPFGPIRSNGVPSTLPLPSPGAYAYPSPALFAQNERPQIDAKLSPQQTIPPQLQYQQIQLQQQAQQLLKGQPQIPQQLQQQNVRQQYVLASQPKQEQQQIATLQKQFESQQPIFQLPQYLQQLTQQPQYLQQYQAVQQQPQQPTQFALQSESPKFQPSQVVKHSQGAAPQQYFQPSLQQQHVQLERQQYLQPSQQQYLQAAQPQYLQPSQQYLQASHQQYLQPSQQQYLQAAQQAVFQQPFVYQGGPAVAAQPQKAALQSLSGGNQVLVGFGGNQLADKQSALAVKREGARGGARQVGAAAAFARGSYSS